MKIQARQSEAEFQKQVMQLAQLKGWRVAHFRPAMNAKGDWRTAVAGDGKGFPDLVLVRGERLIFAELKAADGRLSAEQSEWLDALGSTTATVCVWRPGDWNEILELLGG